MRNLEERGRPGRALFLCGVCSDGGSSRRRRPAAHRPQHRRRRGRRSTWSTCRAAAVTRAARRTDSREAWTAVLRVSVGADQAPMRRRSTRIEGGRIRFTPMFPLDPGRQYHVTFTPPGARADHRHRRPARDGHDAEDDGGAGVSDGDVVPENQLRLYIHFSAPMGRRAGSITCTCSTTQGKEVKDPFLPLDAEFWNDDRTRYTVFFDPGRQKRGIAPIAEMGRSLTEGKSYTLVVDAEWRDGNGLPLKSRIAAPSRSARPTSSRSIRRRGRSRRRPPARSAPLTVDVSRAARSRVAAARARRARRRDGKPIERRRSSSAAAS